MFAEAFPVECKSDVEYVCCFIPSYPCEELRTEEVSSWLLPSGEKIFIPYRVYFDDCMEDIVACLTSTQKIIYHCLFSRSNNGFIRQKHIEALLQAELPDWAIPYILKICDEYVVEILELIYRNLKGRDTTRFKEICKINFQRFRYGHSRMISYWNVFYRNICPNYRNYVGRILYKECFGYTNAMEKAETPIIGDDDNGKKRA